MVQLLDVNESMAKLTHTLDEISDKHAPIEKPSRCQKKLLRKPWISKGIFRSIKVKQRLFKTHFLVATLLKSNYINKTFNNKLNKIKDLALQKYFREQFEINKGNIKRSWKLVDLLINRKRKNSPVISKLLYNNKIMLHI